MEPRSLGSPDIRDKSFLLFLSPQCSSNSHYRKNQHLDYIIKNVISNKNEFKKTTVVREW